MATAPKQSVARTTLLSASTNLAALDSLNYYDATLSADSASLAAHSAKALSSSLLKGDTLTATGVNATLAGGGGLDKLVALGEGYVLVPGAGLNTLSSGSVSGTVNVASLVGKTYAAQTVSLGSGSDTLAIGNASTIGDTLFAKTTGLDVLSLGAGGALSLGAGAQASGLRKVVAGSGALKVTQLAANTASMTLSGGSSNDAFTVSTAAQLAGDVISGGEGIDTLAVLGAPALNDAFGSVSSVEVLALTGASSVTLGSAAVAAGISTVIGDAKSANTFVQTVDAPFTLVGGSKADIFSLSASALAADSLKGDKADTLVINSGAADDDAFTNAVFATGAALSLGSGSAVTLDASAKTSGFTRVFGSNGGNSITQGVDGAAALNIRGGSGNDFISVGSLAQLAKDTIVSGGGIDTLQIGAAGNFGDTLFDSASKSYKTAAIPSFSHIALSGDGGSALTLAGYTGMASKSSLAGVVLTGGSDTVIGSYRGVSLDAKGKVVTRTLLGGANGKTKITETLQGDYSFSKGLVVDASGSAGSDYIVGSSLGDRILLNGDNLSGTTVAGGVGADTLVIASGAADDASFTDVTGIEVLQVSAGGELAIGSGVDVTGISTILAAGAAITHDSTSTKGYRLDASGSSLGSVFTVADASLVALDTILGGSGVDTLHLDDATLTSSALAAIRGVEVLDLAGDSALTLVAAGDASGISTVIGSGGNATFSHQAGSTVGYYFDGTEGLGNVYQSGAASLLGLDTIAGSGTDTLSLGFGGTVNDSLFAHVADVSTVELATSSTLVAGGNLDNTGVSTIVAAGSGQGFRQTADSSNSYLVDGTDATGGISFSLSNQDQLSNTLIGSDFNDTLSIAGSSDLSDGALTLASGIEVLKLDAGSSVTLAGEADGLGFTTIVSGNGDESFVHGANSGAGYYLDGSASSSVIFSMGDVALLTDAKIADTVVGGTGVDTLLLPEDAISDDAFENVSGVEILQLTGSSEVTLGSSADLAGITSVTGGKGDSTITLDSSSTLGHVINVIDGISNTFLLGVDNALQLARQTVVGGAGADTLLLGEDAYGDASFGNVSDVEILSLTGDGSATLGSNADFSGILTVIGGAGSNTVTQGSSSNNGYVLDLSEGTANLVILDNADQSALNTLLGSASTLVSAADTLQIGEGEITDAALRNVSDVEVLQLRGSSEVTLGGNADNSGIVSVFGGAGSSTVTQDAGSNNGYVFDLSDGIANLVVLDNADQSALNTLLGSVSALVSAADTLQIGEGEITDAALRNVSDVEVLQLTGSSEVTLGGNADNSGIVSVFGGAGNSTVTQDSVSGNGFVIDFSDGFNNLVAVDSAAQAGADTILGSGVTINGAADTLQINEDSIEDSTFANVSDIEVLQLTGSSDVTLGGNAGNAGIVSVLGGTGSSTVTHLESNVNATYVDLSDGTSNLLVMSAFTTSGNTLVGGVGADTLQIADEDSIADAIVANVSDIEVLQLTGSSDVTLGGNAGNAGIVSVFGGTGSSSVTHLESDVNATYIDLADGASNLLVMSAFTAGSDTILGSDVTLNGAADTLQLSEDSIIDATFANVSDIEVLQLSGSSDVTLGGNAGNAGIVSVLGGTGNSTVTHLESDVNATYIDGSAGANNLFVMSAFTASGNTLVGGAGADTLQLSEDSIIDATFANVSDIEALQLTGSSDVTLGAYADDSGIVTVAGGAGDSTITQNAISGNGYFLDGSASASNVFALDNADQLLGDTVLGAGNGRDTLVVGEDDLTDASFANVSDVAVLQLTGSSDVTLGAYADDSGIVTVAGGAGDSTITQNAISGNGYFLDGSASASNVFALDNADQLLGDTVLGAGNGRDTLVVGEDDLTDASFANVSDVAVLQLTGSSDVTLGAYADDSGIVTVAGGAGDSTITQNAISGNGYFLDGSASASNVFALDSADQLLGDTVLGAGNGRDTLVVGEDDLTDASFANVSDVAVLQLTGNSDVTLGHKADYAGFVTIAGGTGSSTVTHLIESSNAYVMDGSNGTSNLFVVAGAVTASQDTILGGTGADTIQISIADSIEDAILRNVVDVEVLQLTGNSDVTLGHGADYSGLLTIAGGEGSSTVTHLIESSNAYVLDGSNGASNLFVVAGSVTASEDTILGGTGADTLQISIADSIDDTLFKNVADVEVLALTGNSDVTIGRLADLTGITGVIGGTGSSTITEGADFYSGVTLDGSNGSNNLFQVAGSVWLADDTILGGAGADTLEFTAADQVTDALFANVSGVEVVALAGASDASLGSAAQTAGITSVVAGSGATSVDASAYTIGLTVDLSSALASSQVTGGAGADTIIGSSSADTLAGDTLAGGAGADTFILGAKVSTITDFDVASDILNLRAFGGTAADYSLQSGFGADGEDYTDQLFRADTLGGSTLVANINVVGGSSSDILTAGHILFA